MSLSIYTVAKEILPKFKSDAGVLRRSKVPENACANVPREKLVEIDPPAAFLKVLPRHLHNLVTGFGDGYLSLRVTSKLGLPRIPQGYYYKGGAARESLRRIVLPMLPELFIRDLDLFRYTETDDSRDHEISRSLMLKDYEFGRGVEVVESQNLYLVTRDLTVNEVLCDHQQIVCSLACLEDMTRGILRPTKHVQNASGEIDGFTAMKILRFAAEKLVKGVSFRIFDLPPCHQIDPFALALNLERSFARGPEYGEEFITLAWEYRALFPEERLRPSTAQCVERLGSLIPQGKSFFRYTPY